MDDLILYHIFNEVEYSIPTTDANGRAMSKWWGYNILESRVPGPIQSRVTKLICSMCLYQIHHWNQLF